MLCDVQYCVCEYIVQPDGVSGYMWLECEWVWPDGMSHIMSGLNRLTPGDPQTLTVYKHGSHMHGTYICTWSHGGHA